MSTTSTNQQQQQHTPGPWIVGRSIKFDNAIWAEDADGESVLIAGVIGPHYLPQEIPANAALMAAAPEMLQELRILAAQMKYADPCGTVKAVIDSWRVDVLAVIAKATASA